MSPELRAIAASADARFPKLEGHGERTASFAVGAAHAMGVSPERLVSLRVAAALHYSWLDVGECPCCGDPPSHILRWHLGREPRAADFIRGMFASWNMAPIESSILAAACRLDLAEMGIEATPIDYRPGVVEAIDSIKALVTPLDYVQ